MARTTQLKKVKALSIVYPGGQKIASGEKTIEVRGIYEIELSDALSFSILK